MEKIEFCNTLVQLREQAQIGKNEMCRMMGCLFTHLQRIESGENSFAISKAIKYLDLVNAKIIVSKGEDSYSITSREKLSSVATLIRQDLELTISAMSKNIGVSRNMIMDIEQNKADTGIDKVLQFFDKTGFELRIIHK